MFWRICNIWKAVIRLNLRHHLFCTLPQLKCVHSPAGCAMYTMKSTLQLTLWKPEWSGADTTARYHLSPYRGRVSLPSPTRATSDGWRQARSTRPSPDQSMRQQRQARNRQCPASILALLTSHQSPLHWTDSFHQVSKHAEIRGLNGRTSRISQCTISP